MKTYNKLSAGKFEYLAPTIETLEVSTEQGFAVSSGVEAPDWGTGNSDWWSTAE